MKLDKMTFMAFNFFFFGDSFNIWSPLLIITLYYQTKTLIGFSVGGVGED